MQNTLSKKSNSSVISSFFVAILKGIMVSLLLILLFAFVLKLFTMDTKIISYINQIIKVISILVITFTFVRKWPNRAILKGALCGVVYTVISYLLFSILNNSFSLSKGNLTDLLFSVLIGIICAVIVKAFKK